MKTKLLITSLCLLLTAVMIMPASAQTKKKKKKHAKTAVVSKKKHSTKVAMIDTAKHLDGSDSTKNVVWNLGADSAVMDGAYVTKDFLNNKVTPYPFLREADVMYRKRIWREIDVHEKMNKFLTYPRNSLIDVLVEKIKAGELTAYSPIATTSKDNGDEFKSPYKSLNDFNKSLGAGRETVQVADINNPGVMHDKTVDKNFDPGSVVAYRIKEDWIFDKQRSVFEPRILGIAPVVAQLNTNGDTIGTRAIFWVYYPEARNVLSHAQVYNRQSDGTNLSYDDVFIKRMFSSYIIKESNPDDVAIKNYANVKNPLDALFEGERVKKDLMSYESDLWEY